MPGFNLAAGSDAVGGIMGAFGLTGVGTAFALAGLAGSLLLDDPGQVANPLPWNVNPYGEGQLLWGLPVHPADAAWAAQNLNGSQNPSNPSGVVFPVTPGQEIVTRHGGVEALSKVAAGLLPGKAVFVPAPPGTVLHSFSIPAGAGGGSNVAGVKRFYIRTAPWWGLWGGEGLPAQSAEAFVEARMVRIQAQWNQGVQPDFTPRFWQLDYRDQASFAVARFAGAPIQHLQQFLGFVPSSNPWAKIQTSALNWFNSNAGASAKQDYDAKNATLISDHNELTAIWNAWRTSLAAQAATTQGEGVLEALENNGVIIEDPPLQTLGDILTVGDFQGPPPPPIKLTPTVAIAAVGFAALAAVLL